MKIGKRGQVTISKELPERFGLGPETEVEFRVVREQIVLQKKPRGINLDKWKGKCQRSVEELGYGSVDHYLEDMRGR